MKVDKLADLLSAKALAMPDGDREVKGVYIGDLLSWVMGRASHDDAWITIMSNLNVVAVATLADVSVIVLAEGVIPDQNVIDTAVTKGVNLISTEMTAYQIAAALSEIIER